MLNSSHIDPVEKYLGNMQNSMSYSFTREKSAPGKISASGICENSKSNRFTREVSTDQKKYLHKEYICQNLISNGSYWKSTKTSNWCQGQITREAWHFFVFNFHLNPSLLWSQDSSLNTWLGKSIWSVKEYLFSISTGQNSIPSNWFWIRAKF